MAEGKEVSYRSISPYLEGTTSSQASLLKHTQITMKSATLVLLAVVATTTEAFSGSSSFAGSSAGLSAANGNKLSMEYIPSGMSKEQWQKLKNKEKNTNKGKNLGKVGITSFQSRSFADWQKSGGKNLFPVDPKKAKSAKEVPYMQRPGGSADDGDLKKGGGMFSLFGKKKEAEPEPEEEKKNWWTL